MRTGGVFGRLARTLLVPVVLAAFAIVPARTAWGEDLMRGPAGRGLGGHRVGGGEVIPGAEGGAEWKGLGGGDRETVQSFLEYGTAEAGLTATQGTIVFTVTRDEDFAREALFSLNDAGNERRFALRIYWNGNGGVPSGLPTLAFYDDGGDDLWFVDNPANPATPLFGVPLGKNVARGQKVEIALTWGLPGQNQIYVDRLSLGARTGPNFSFQARVAASTRLLIGAEMSGSRVPAGSWSVARSVIGNFRVYDRVLTPVEFDAPAGTPPVVDSFSHDGSAVAGFSGKLVADDVVTVTLTGTPGAVATADLVRKADRRGEMPLSWKGWGVYLEEKRFFDEGEVDLRRVDGYKVWVSKEPFPVVAPADIEAAVAAGATLTTIGGVAYRFDGPPVGEIDDVTVQSHLLNGLEADAPYYVMVAAVMRGGALRAVISPRAPFPLVESIEVPGTYAGPVTIGYQDKGTDYALIGRVERNGSAAALAAAEGLALDTALRVDVKASVEEMAADEKSEAGISATVSDANGKAVRGHEVKFVLATTSTYTGVVGGGAFADEVGGALTETAKGETDMFGKVEASYRAGFAAKTVIVVARDMVSNDTGAAYIKTYITASAELVLEPVEMVSALSLGYAIEVTSSDEWLTADGKSTARITAKVTRNGEPVEGHDIDFSVGGGGTIRAADSVTGKNGVARAVYTAGKKIGVAVITATDTTVGISGSVQIELRSDAPAKIAITLTPAKLPADGKSKSDLVVLVTDINDNPNEGTIVEYALSGGGRFATRDDVTDRNGEAKAVYVAGSSPGKVTIGITVRSLLPTEEDIVAARELGVAVPELL